MLQRHCIIYNIMWTYMAHDYAVDDNTTLLYFSRELNASTHTTLIEGRNWKNSTTPSWWTSSICWIFLWGVQSLGGEPRKLRTWVFCSFTFTIYWMNSDPTRLARPSGWWWNSKRGRGQRYPSGFRNTLKRLVSGVWSFLVNFIREK